MHPNPVFHTETEARNISFVRDRAFGTLAINGDDGPLTSHVPILLSEDGTSAELHLVRSNPIARTLDGPIPAVFTILGPDSYISPDWYGIDDQVPTWNYIAIRLTGMLSLRPIAELRPILDRLSAHFETRLHPKPPWMSDKMSDGVMERMMRSIIPLHFAVTDIAGTWKLNQNKAVETRLNAAKHVETSGIGAGVETIASMMRDTTKKDLA